MSDLKPCPHCGGRCDPKGWLNNSGVSGPECIECGATAYSVDSWNARAAPVAAPVQVKALQWKDSEWSDTYAACLIGAYIIKKDFTLILIDDGIIGHFDSAKDAKAAAQADYEQRIKSALISGDTSNG